MENLNHELSNWIPYKLIEKNSQVYFEWIYLSDLKFAEPFFDETISKCKSHSYNSKPFKVMTTAENLIDWAKDLFYVELKSLIFHVSRCGSTMLSQSLATSSENIMISEAPIIDEILRNNNLALNQKAALLKAVIAFLGQKRFSNQRHLIIKLDAWHIFNADFLRSVFSNIPFALLYRNPVEVLKSHQKLTGMHMVPNLLPFTIFGISAEEINEISFHQYRALVLEKYFQGFLEFYKTDNNIIKLNYNEGMKNVVQKFISFINIYYVDNELDKMYGRLEKHSKNESNVFKGDSFEEESLQVDFTQVTLLHEKLNNSFIES